MIHKLIPEMAHNTELFHVMARAHNADLCHVMAHNAELFHVMAHNTELGYNTLGALDADVFC